MKVAKKKQDKAGILPEDDLKNKDYEPEGIEKESFDSIFNKYIEHVSNSKGKPSSAVNAYNTVTDKPTGEEEEDIVRDAIDASIVVAKEQQAELHPLTIGGQQLYMTKEEFDIVSEAIKQTGEDTFTQGFELLFKNKSLMLEDEGSVKLDDLLSGLKLDKKTREIVLNVCGKYLLINSLKI